jgi:transposase
MMGTRVTRAAAHLSVEQIKERMRREPRFWVRQRWWIIYTALIAPRKAAEIAKQTGVSVTTVRRVIAGYKRLGPAAVETAGKGGRRKASMSLEQERQLLAPFFARAQRGEITTVGEIKQAFEAQVGHEVEASTIYRLLHRHGWRKLVPRPRHPKANADSQAAFKKTFKPASKRH